MKKTILILILITLASVAVFTQDVETVEKRIKVVKNRQLVINGEIKDGVEYHYIFKDPKAKILNIKIISKSADFKLAVADDIEVYEFTKWIKSYNGKANNELNTQDWIIKVRSNDKSAQFRLVILVK